MGGGGGEEEAGEKGDKEEEEDYSTVCDIRKRRANLRNMNTNLVEVKNRKLRRNMKRKK